MAKMAKMTKLARVVLALSLIGALATEAADLKQSDELGLGSEVMNNEDEKASELLGDLRVPPLLQTLEAKITGLSGLQPEEMDELLNHVKEVSAEYDKFEGVCRNRTKGFLEINYEFNMTYNSILQQLLSKHKLMTAMKTQLKLSQASLREANENNTVLDRKLQEALRELEALKAQKVDGAASTPKDAEELRKQLDEMAANNTRLASERNEISEELKNLMQTYITSVSKHGKETNALKKKIKSLTAKKQQLLDGNEALTAKLNQTSQQLEECLKTDSGHDCNNSANEELVKNITQLTTENNELKEKLQNALQELEKLKETPNEELQAQLESIMKATNETVRQYEEKLAASEILIAALKEESRQCLDGSNNTANEKLMKTIKQLLIENDELKEKLQHALQELEKLKETPNEELSGRLDEMGETIKRLTNERNEVKEELQNVMQTYITSVSKHETETTAFKKQITSLAMEKQHLLDDNEALAAKFNQTSQQLEECLKAGLKGGDHSSEQGEELMKNITQVMTVNDVLNEKLQNALQELKKLKENPNLDELRAQLTEMAENIARLADEKKKTDEELKNVLQVCESTVQKHGKETSAMKEKIESLTVENQQLLDGNADLTKILNETSEQLEECLKTGSNQACNLTEIDAEMIKTITQVMELNDVLNQRLKNTTKMFKEMQNNADAEQLRAQLCQMRINLTELGREKVELNEDLKNALHKFIKTMVDMKQKLIASESSVVQLTRDNLKLLNNNEELTEMLNESMQKLEELTKAYGGKNCSDCTQRPDIGDNVEEELMQNITQLKRENEGLTEKLRNALRLIKEVSGVQRPDTNIDAEQLSQLLSNVTRMSAYNEVLSEKLDEALREISALKAGYGNSGPVGADNSTSAVLEKLNELEEAFEHSRGSRKNASSSISSLPTSCAEALERAGNDSASGVYQLFLPASGLKPFYVYCLKDAAGGAAWTVVQRRVDNSTNFYRGWDEYKVGFGNLHNEFFIGLDKLNALTQVQLQELRVELVDFDCQTRYAMYDNFAIGDEKEKYALNVLGEYEGNAGDSLRRQQGQKFSTGDNDNDSADENCAETYFGAWWYEACQDSNLNGIYLAGDMSKDRYGQGIVWSDFRGQYYSLKSVYMAIRPKV